MKKSSELALLVLKEQERVRKAALKVLKKEHKKKKHKKGKKNGKRWKYLALKRSGHE